MILEPRDNFPTMTPALNEWKNSRDANAALKKLNERSNCIEDLLLRGLAARGPTDLVNALSVVLSALVLFASAIRSLVVLDLDISTFFFSDPSEYSFNVLTCLSELHLEPNFVIPHQRIWL